MWSKRFEGRDNTSDLSLATATPPWPPPSACSFSVGGDPRGLRVLRKRARRGFLDPALAQFNGDLVGGIEVADRLSLLSLREREVMLMVVNGRTSTEIGAQLQLSPKTVDTYRSRLMLKLDVPDLAGLVRFAALEGLIE